MLERTMPRGHTPRDVVSSPAIVARGLASQRALRTDLRGAELAP
jgi:hypothetical protein